MHVQLTCVLGYYVISLSVDSSTGSDESFSLSIHEGSIKVSKQLCSSTVDPICVCTVLVVGIREDDPDFGQFN